MQKKNNNKIQIDFDQKAWISLVRVYILNWSHEKVFA